jgi:hypothetical protein
MAKDSSRRAVIFVHGIGEQIPMQTLRAFVETAWSTDATLVSADKPDPLTGGTRTRNAIWSKPDRASHGFDLRRLTTAATKSGRLTDFCEYCRAHLLYGTTIGDVAGWLASLVLRNPFSRVPAGVRSAWIALWGIALVTLAGAFLWVRSELETAATLGFWAFLAGLAGTGLAAVLCGVFLNRAGDVPRYVSAKPGNVARSQEIREKGVALLETLLDRKDFDGSPLCDRIVKVGHSPGTIVA